MDIHATKQEIAEKLRLDEAAAAAANVENPATNAVSLSGDENMIVAEARNFGEKYAARLDEHRRQTEKATEKCENAARESRRRRERTVPGIAPSETDPKITGAALNNAIAAYNQFKQNNGLRRDAGDDDRLAQFMWVAAVVVVESALNSHFFAPASGRGLSGGFATAFFISIVNVGFAFLGGVLGLRYAKNHCNAAANLGGLLWFLLCLSVCAAMISLATFYRGHIEVLRGDDLDSAKIAAQASGAAVKSLFAFDAKNLFASVDSVILFFAGMLCAIAGVWKGYEYDDPYPGFGTMWRQKEDADARHNAAVRANNAAREVWLQNAGGDIRQAENNLRAAVDELNTKLGGMRGQSAKLANAPQDAANLAGALLQQYRIRNAEIRATDAPSYFSAFPTADDFSELAARCADARRESENAGKKADAILAQCRGEFGEIRKALGADAR